MPVEGDFTPWRGWGGRFLCSGLGWHKRVQQQVRLYKEEKIDAALKGGCSS